MGSGESFSFIVNPYAGRGAGRILIPWLENELRRAGVPGDIAVTESRGHATELARKAAGATIIAVGGDGTINEVVNGIDLARKSLGIIPCGSGNDLIKSLGIPNDKVEAFRIVMGGNSRQIDLGRIQVTDGSGKKQRLFVNGVGVGFDAAVAERTTHITYARGFAVYMIAALQTLTKYRAPLFKMNLDGEHLSSKCLLIAIGNGTCAGGGFYLTPAAIIDDGKLDVCIIQEKTILGILSIMPKVMKGLHGRTDGAEFYRVQSMDVQSDDSFYAHADGEILGGGQIKHVCIDIHSSKMTLMTV